MTFENPTPQEKESLQLFYLACRRLYSQGIVGKAPAQKSLDEVLCGFLGKSAWRPTHMSHSAAKEILSGNKSGVQRAHGALEDRLDRYDRTIRILEEPEAQFDQWWKFFREHDATVVITRAEHNSGVKFKREDLIELPHDTDDMFVTSGFSLRIRVGKEIAWLRNRLSDHEHT